MLVTDLLQQLRTQALVGLAHTDDSYKMHMLTGAVRGVLALCANVMPQGLARSDSARCN